MLRGQWITTPYTGLKKFVTDTDEAELIAAANQAITYHNMAGYSVESVFASESSSDNNYPIIVNGTLLDPKF